MVSAISFASLPLLLRSLDFASFSVGDARRAIQGNAISVNKYKITSHEAMINHEALLHGKYIMVENGKKNIDRIGM